MGVGVGGGVSRPVNLDRSGGGRGHALVIFLNSTCFLGILCIHFKHGIYEIEQEKCH